MSIHIHIHDTAYDPAVVNVPLSKRGNINNELDKYKREQAEKKAVEAKTQAVKTKELKAQAKQLLAEYEAKIIERHGPKFGAAKLKAMLTDWSKWEPAKLISFIEKFKRE